MFISRPVILGYSGEPNFSVFYHKTCQTTFNSEKRLIASLLDLDGQIREPHKQDQEGVREDEEGTPSDGLMDQINFCCSEIMINAEN